jgi:hypothetical protein
LTLFLLATITFPATSALATEILDDFDNKYFTFKQWDDRQADRALLMFMTEPDGKRTYLQNRIDGIREHTDPSTACPEEEPLAPSLITSQKKREQKLECPMPEVRNGLIVYQRNELRPRVTFHPAEAPHWYTITFKLVGADGDKIPGCGSVRWVVAQWKYTEMKCDANDSPFLAQRFDNGILHVTVEDGFCRCMIASAPGDPNKTTVLASVLPSARLKEVAPLKCLDTEGKLCNAKQLKLRLFASSRYAIENLPDPKDDWVEMTYFVQAGGSGGTRYDVYANGQFIVRALGALPQGINFPNRVKFKFGHYRDKIQNWTDLLVDRICISERDRNCSGASMRQ